MQTENGFSVLDFTELVLTSTVGVSTAKQMCTAGIAATTLVNIGGMARFSTATTHGFFDKQLVNIIGAADTGYNGYVRINVESATVFTYTLVGTPVTTPDAGGATAATLKVRKALIQAPATNTDTVTFGPNTNASARPLAPGEEYELTSGVKSASGYRSSFDLAKWYFMSATASQKISILYIPA